MRGWVLAPIHALIRVESIAAWNERSQPQYFSCIMICERPRSGPRPLTYRDKLSRPGTFVPGRDTYILYVNAWMGASTHPRIEVILLIWQEGREDQTPSLPPCSEHNGRKDLGSFLPSCTRQLCLVSTKQSCLAHDGRKDSRFF